MLNSSLEDNKYCQSVASLESARLLEREDVQGLIELQKKWRELQSLAKRNWRLYVNPIFCLVAYTTNDGLMFPLTCSLFLVLN